MTEYSSNQPNWKEWLEEEAFSRLVQIAFVIDKLARYSPHPTKRHATTATPPKLVDHYGCLPPRMADASLLPRRIVKETQRLMTEPGARRQPQSSSTLPAVPALTRALACVRSSRRCCNPIYRQPALL